MALVALAQFSLASLSDVERAAAAIARADPGRALALGGHHGHLIASRSSRVPRALFRQATEGLGDSWERRRIAHTAAQRRSAAQTGVATACVRMPRDSQRGGKKPAPREPKETRRDFADTQM